MNMKKMLLVALAVVLALAVPVSAHAAGLEPNVKSFVLMDAGSGTVLEEKDADAQLPCASVIKTMSMLLLFDAVETGRLSLSDTATVSEHAASMGGTQVFLDVHTTHTVENLMKAMVVCSANDATVALAEKIAGSEDAFVEMMNKKAQAMGLGAHFVNSTGMDADGQTMSARDIATVSQALVKYDLFFTWSTTWMENYKHPDGRETEMVNANRLVKYYDGGDGLCTGSSPGAGYCIAATAQRSSGRFIYVALGAPGSDTRFEDARAALDYAFAGFSPTAVVREGQQLCQNYPVSGGTQDTVDIVAGAGFSALLEKGSESRIEKELVLLEEVKAPVEKGQKLGYLRILLDGEEIGRVDAVAAEDVPSRNFSNALHSILIWWLFG
jgi:serine-type D-Ala-D-Ala carboxypeptidase (penicillin-binding protein 5/6)